MQTVSYSEARATLATLLDHVTDDQEPVVIARRGKPAVVLVALSELEGYRETAYLLRSPANADRLLTALARAGRNEGEVLTVAELEQRIGFRGPLAPPPPRRGRVGKACSTPIFWKTPIFSSALTPAWPGGYSNWCRPCYATRSLASASLNPCAVVPPGPGHGASIRNTAWCTR